MVSAFFVKEIINDSNISSAVQSLSCYDTGEMESRYFPVLSIRYGMQLPPPHFTAIQDTALHNVLIQISFYTD